MDTQSEYKENCERNETFKTSVTVIEYLPLTRATVSVHRGEQK
jgi:hypothetical protein